MTPMIIRNSLLALLVGMAAPAFAQDTTGQSDDEILLNGGVVVNPAPGDDTVAGPAPGIDGIPEEPQPRKRRQPKDGNGLTISPNDPPIVDDGGNPDGEVLPRRRHRQPGPDTNELPISPNDPPIVDDGGGQGGDYQPRRRHRQPGPDTNELPISPNDPPIVDDGGGQGGDYQPRRRHRPPVEEAGRGPDFAGPSAVEIERSLDVEPRIRLRPNQRVTIREFERRPDLRRAAPSIDIQAINFETGSAEVPFSQYRKVENIAIAMGRLLRRDPDTTVLIEGHTDAVGSYGSNQILSERRARSLKRVLVREFGIPADALETVGYGEEYLLVPTTRENWRNRRVTLRSIGDFVR